MHKKIANDIKEYYDISLFKGLGGLQKVELGI